jgi:hypothetical protein
MKHHGLPRLALYEQPHPSSSLRHCHCHCGTAVVIAALPLSLRHCRCHCGTAVVIAALPLSLRATTRNPVTAWHWIPDQVRDDKLQVRDDKLRVRDDKLRVRDDKLRVRDDNFGLKVRARNLARFGVLSMNSPIPARHCGTAVARCGTAIVIAALPLSLRATTRNPWLAEAKLD